MTNSMQPYSAGVLDGSALIEMNNLSVGYFPTEAPEIGVYPPPVVTQSPQPVPNGQNLEKNS